MHSPRVSRRPSAFVAAAFLAAVAAVPALPTLAAIDSTTMIEIAAPISFLEGDTESSAAILILDEGLSIVPPDIFVNAFGVGTHDGSAPPYLLVPEGILVNSYLVHFDPVGSSFATATGEVVFEAGETIIGVQTHTPLLYTTDGPLGDPLATYPAAFIEFRAFESLPGLDTVTLPPGMGSASFTLFAELGVDHARIITLPVPEPATAAALLSLTATARLRRRR